MRSHPRRFPQLFTVGAAAVPASAAARGAGPGGRAGQHGQPGRGQPRPAAAPSMRLPGRRDRLGGCRGEGGEKAGRGQRGRGGEGRRDGGREGGKSDLAQIPK